MKARVEFEITDPRLSKVVFDSVNPEVGQVPSGKVSESITRSGKGVIVLLEGEDLPSLQAAVNSYFSILRLSHDIGGELIDRD